MRFWTLLSPPVCCQALGRLKFAVFHFFFEAVFSEDTVHSSVGFFCFLFSRLLPVLSLTAALPGQKFKTLYSEFRDWFRGVGGSLRAGCGRMPKVGCVAFKKKKICLRLRTTNQNNQAKNLDTHTLTSDRDLNRNGLPHLV